MEELMRELLHVLWADIPRSATGTDYDVASVNTATSHGQSLLFKWANDDASTKLVIPLAYNYHKARFSALKYRDRIVAGLVRTCDFLDIHLCRLTRDKSGIFDWISIDDQPVRIGKWYVHKDEILRYNENDVSGDIFGEVALVIWPKARKSRAVFVSNSLEYSLKWLEDHHKDQLTSSDAGKNDLVELCKILTSNTCLSSENGKTLEKVMELSSENGKRLEKVMELFLKSGLIDHAFFFICWLRRPDMFICGSRRILMNMVDVLLVSGEQDTTLRVIKLWGWDLIRENYMVEAIRSYGWDKCKEVIESLLIEVPQGTQVEDMVYVIEGLESCGYHEVAMVIGKKLFDKVSNKQYALDWISTYRIAKLVGLYVKHGLIEEAYYLIEMVPMDFTHLIDSCNFREEIFDVLYASLDKWQIKRKRSLGPSGFKDGFLEMIGSFIFKLVSKGDNTIAKRFLRKWLSLLPDNIDEELRTRGRSCEILTLLLLYGTHPKQGVQIALEMMERDHVLHKLITFMKSRADFIELKQEKDVTQAFAELCLHQLHTKGFLERANDVGHKVSKLHEEWSEAIYLNEVVKDFLATLFWLDDKRVLNAMVKRLVELTNLTRMLFEKENGLVTVAMQSGVYARKALKKLAKARISYLEEKVSPKKRQKLDNPRMECVFCDMLMEQRRELQGLELLLQVCFSE